MASAAISEILTQSANLRAELKEWERAFAAQNGGRKAERNDIKKVPEIAAKYKEYSRLKALESSSDNPDGPKSVQLEERPRKRKHTSKDGPDTAQNTSTPRKTAKGAFETPSKNRISNSHPSQVDPYISPTALRRLFSPSTHRTPLKNAVGPTPQRDGKALGLFDLLSESGGSTATPSADRVASVRTANVQTPSKRKTMDTIMEEDEEGEEESPRAGRTPASSGKKWMLSALFATPTTLRYSAMVEDHNHITERNQNCQTNPEGTANDITGSETPSFLRRSNSARYAASHSANPNGLSPIAVRKPPQFVGKGLSALVQGLRDMEEERLEDELDVLREIEAEQAALNVEVADSQAPAENIGRPWRKKGQKRTTRRVRMKPVISKPTSKPQGSTSDGESEHQAADEDAAELAAVPDTQQPRTLDAAFGEDQDDNFDEEDDQVSLHTMSEPDFDSDPDYGEDTRPVTKSKSFSEKMKEAIGVVQPQPAERPAKATQPVVEEEETKKVRARKVNPEAHANYRSLKIRNKNSKGRGAGRFRRR
ncbi:protein sld2 [Aspergillus udagawae]|uniref:DNA replication regulator SLD2 n=1 Tax=Aspergillus udagawae TaxID=91492 RepID=A0A8E0QPR1_9EURO|nr:DNA replication regulator sld2 [Aspergillus udagawae]GIC86841.1 DNA replication regulator sld2 [Aspergillus udagawae]